MTRDEMWKRLNVLRADAKIMDIERRGRGVYEWELGYMVASALAEEVGCYKEDEIIGLMGVPVRINIENPDIIKLWREVS